MHPYIPQEHKKEYDRITELWLQSGLPIDDVVEKYATPAYKAWRRGRIERAKELYKRGIIEN